MSAVALAVDIGGTKIEAALVTAEGRIVDGSRHRAPSGRDRSAADLDASVAEVVRAALAAVPDGAHVVGAGVGSAGPVSLPAGAISPLNLPQWRDHPIGDQVAALSGLPTTVRLDGQCFALAEAWVGSLAGSRNAIAIVVSTGVGSGLVVDGNLVSGNSGNAGHLGQMLIRDVDPGENPDIASVERVCSGTGTVAWAQAQGWPGASGEELVADAAAGDELARRALRRSTDGMAQAIVSAGALVDLEAASIAGGLGLGYPGYVDDVASALERFSVLPYTTRIAVRRSSLGGDAPLIGAGGLVFRA
jgi:glucokinase